MPDKGASFKPTDNSGLDGSSAEAYASVPQWAKEAIWYQIFVERFRNGDPANDPTPRDIAGAYPEEIPSNWKITPWTQDWYQPDPWFDEVPLPDFKDRLQLRRYGGDLQGVLDRLDYLERLGINAIYFNPLNDAPSLHKYDPRSWHHIDRNFGPDPAGDLEIINTEDPVDPTTWKWTSADRLFLRLIRECHRRQIRIIMDYSWNHTGIDFWAMKDILEKGADSAYVGWYHIDLPGGQGIQPGELKYRGWAGLKYLPELKKDTLEADTERPFEGNLAHPSVRKHIFKVAARWLDPHGKGNSREGIDGFRLDVAAEVPMDFWREFRRQVRAVKPDAFLVGEVWWKNWPDELLDPHPFLQGDMFDAVMNYRWYRSARHFFAAAPAPLRPSAFVEAVKGLTTGIRETCQYAMMNLTASHDTPRTSTSLYNSGKYKFEAKPYENTQYKIDKPDPHTRTIQKMLLIHQYTYIGAPHIWYGDEVGMWGADDPDARKPMVWEDLTYEDEVAHPLGLDRKRDPVIPDKALFRFIAKLIRIRKSSPELTRGTIHFLLVNDEDNTLAYSRNLGDQLTVVAFNRSEEIKKLEIPLARNVHFYDALHPEVKYPVSEGLLNLELPPLKGVILKTDKLF